MEKDRGKLHVFNKHIRTVTNDEWEDRNVWLSNVRLLIICFDLAGLNLFIFWNILLVIINKWNNKIFEVYQLSKKCVVDTIRLKKKHN